MKPDSKIILFRPVTASDGIHETVVTVLAPVAILLASINVFGGFAVPRRMLGMFTR